MVKYNIGYLYNQKKIERKGFVAHPHFRSLLYEMTANNNDYVTCQFQDLFKKYKSKSNNGLNYKLFQEKDKIKIKIFPINIRIFSCEKLKININNGEYYTNWEGIDKKYGKITGKKIEEESIKFFIDSNSEKYESDEISQRVNVEEADVLNLHGGTELKLLKELKIERNISYLFEAYSEKEIYKNNSSIYNLPEKEWGNLWENYYFDLREDTIVKDVIQKEEKKKILLENKYDCKNARFDFSSPKKFTNFSIENAKDDMLNTERINCKTLKIINSEIKKIKLNEKTINIILENTKIDIKEILKKQNKIKQLNISKTKNQTFQDITVKDFIEIRENIDCKFGEIRLSKKNGSITLSENENVEIGNIKAEGNDVRFYGGKYNKIGTIYCEEIKFFFKDKDEKEKKFLTIPNEININFQYTGDGKDLYKKGTLFLENINVLEEEKPLIINVKNLNEIAFAYQTIIPRKVIINILSFTKFLHNDESNILDYFTMSLYDAKEIITAWNLDTFGFKIPKKYSMKRLVYTEKSGKTEEKTIFDINKYLKEKNIEINYKGRKLTEKEIFNSFYGKKYNQVEK